MFPRAFQVYDTISSQMLGILETAELLESLWKQQKQELYLP